MKVLRTDDRGEFIFNKLQMFCEKKGILIKYTAPYIHKENRLTKQGYCTLVTMKDLILIDSGLPNGFWAKAIKTANYLQNRLLTRNKTHNEMIPKEAWTC